MDPSVKETFVTEAYCAQVGTDRGSFRVVLIQKVDWQPEVWKLGWSRYPQVENFKGAPSRSRWG